MKEETYTLQLFIRQTDTVLHSHFIAHTALLAQYRDALHLDSILDDACGVATGRSVYPPHAPKRRHGYPSR